MDDFWCQLLANEEENLILQSVAHAVWPARTIEPYCRTGM